MKKALLIISIIAIIVITGSLLYYFVFFRPGIEKAEIKLEEQKAAEEVLRKENLEKCLEEARKNHLEMVIALEKSSYPMEQYKTLMEMIKDFYQADIDACNMRYGK